MIDPTDIELIHNNVPFTRLHGKRVLITGGTGFVGRWLQIVPDGIHITALSHLQYDYSRWDKQDWDYIIHLALTTPDRVIQVARDCGAVVLFTSSGAVHDAVPGEYALGKIADEARLLNSGIDARVARLWTFAGAYCNRPHFALARMIYSAIHGEPIRYNTRATRSYLYAADMAIWLWRILLNGVNGRIYDVGSARPVKMQKLAQEVRRHFPVLQPIELQPYDADDARPYYVPDTEQTRGELGLREFTTFEAAIAKTVKAFLQEMEVGG